jgi:Cu+-exporting ATPase
LVDGSIKEKLKSGIEDLGYTVIPDLNSTEKIKKPFLSNHLNRFLFCLPFTAILWLHMFDKWIPLHFLMNPWIQLVLCLPAYWVGMSFFGKSAINSMRNGLPNMNVLIALGATAAFVYSLTGTILNLGSE